MGEVGTNLCLSKWVQSGLKEVKTDISRGGDRVRGGHGHIGKASSMGLENALYKV